MRLTTLLVIAAGAMLLTAGCSGTTASPASAPDRQQAVTGGPAPTMAELTGATYTGLWEKGPVTLAAGKWEGPPFVEGGASVPAVWLTEDFYLAGDLDGDGADEAVAHLTSGSGGTGSFGYLAVMGRQRGGIVQKAIGEVGDRVQIRGARLADGAVVLDVLQVGPNDGMCCPSQLATRTFKLQKGRLVETASQVTGSASLATLEDQEWVLRKLSPNESAAAEPAVTLVFKGGTVSGSSGCNRYSGPVRPGESATGLAIGPLASTRMACPPNVMKLEQRYADALQKANSWGFQAGRLVINYGGGQVFGSLIFQGRAPSEKK